MSSTTLDLEPGTEHKTDTHGAGTAASLDPFGDEQNAKFKYRTMTWWQTGMLMIAETISLGILTLPAAMSTLGVVSGVIAIIGLGMLSTYTGFVIGQFKQRYMHVHSMADAGGVIFGRLGQELLGVMQLIFFIFVMGSHILTFSIMMNALTNHATCTIIFTMIGLIVSWILTLPRRLEDLSYISIISFVSIIGAILTTMIGVSTPIIGLNPVALFPRHPSFHDAFLAVANILFAYAGHAAFFTLFSELQDIGEYPKALAMLQITDTILYTIAAIVIYCFVGPDIASPALNSTRPLIRKIAYGIALPTIVIAGIVNAHVAVKFIYIRIFRGTERIHERSFVSQGTWILLCSILWVVSWIIAEAVPVFNDLLGLTSSLFASWFTFGLSGFFWLHLSKGHWFDSWQKILLLALNLLNIIVSLVICIIGLFSSIKSIRYNVQHHVSGHSFSCADNSAVKTN